jgi:6,7-dimethyl-8-ribityllumazine synthase
VGEYAPGGDELDASDVRLAIVAARFNEHITERLVDGARTTIASRGGSDDVDVYWVPGAFEIPLVAKRLAASGSVDAVICLGAVVRGATAHFEYVAGPCASGVAAAALETGVPIVFGVLTTEDDGQALERAGGREGNKGVEAALTAIEMVRLLRALPPPARGPARGEQRC